MRGAARRIAGRQRAPGHEQREAGERQVHEEDEPPVDRGQQPPEERADRRADARRRAGDPEVRAGLPSDRVAAQEGEAVRHDGRRGDGLLQPERDEHEQVRRERGADGRDDEVHERAEHEPPAAEPIAQPARDRLQGGHRDEIRGDEPGERDVIRSEVAADERQRDDDHRRVQRDEEIAERDREDERRDARHPHALGERRAESRAGPPVASRSGAMRATANSATRVHATPPANRPLAVPATLPMEPMTIEPSGMRPMNTIVYTLMTRPRR